MCLSCTRIRCDLSASQFLTILRQFFRILGPLLITLGLFLIILGLLFITLGQYSHNSTSASHNSLVTTHNFSSPTPPTTANHRHPSIHPSIRLPPLNENWWKHKSNAYILKLKQMRLLCNTTIAILAYKKCTSSVTVNELQWQAEHKNLSTGYDTYE